MMWPIATAKRPMRQPNGANSMPVRISATDTAAPNQITAEAVTESLSACCSIKLFPLYI